MKVLKKCYLIPIKHMVLVPVKAPLSLLHWTRLRLPKFEIRRIYFEPLSILEMVLTCYFVKYLVHIISESVKSCSTPDFLNNEN